MWVIAIALTLIALGQLGMAYAIWYAYGQIGANEVGLHILTNRINEDKYGEER